MYYGNPRNRFWPVLAAVFGEPVPTDNDGRRALALRHGVALWDVLQSCSIHGASDASIADARPNDVAGLLARTGISRERNIARSWRDAATMAGWSGQ